MYQQRILIDSRDRVSGTVQSSTFMLDKPLQNVTCARVDFAQIFNTFFNVDSSNNQLIIDDTAKIIPSGYYNSVDLVSVIDGLLKIVDASIGVVYSTVTGICSWTLNSHVLSLSNSRFLTGTDNQKTGSFQTIINTSFPLSIQVISPEFSGLDVQRSSNRAMLDQTPLCTIPIWAANNDLNFYEPRFPNTISIQSTSIQRFTINLVDSYGKALSNLTDYQLHITFF